LDTLIVSFLANAYLALGEVDAGLAAADEGLSIAERNGEYFAAPELHRLKGELLRTQEVSGSANAEAEFVTALDFARKQESKALELRAATSLARLWQQQGKRKQARNLLSPVYGWFTEGFDTKDLQDAKAMLEELRWMHSDARLFP
jgi:predicted ATPase